MNLMREREWQLDRNSIGVFMCVFDKRKKGRKAQLQRKKQKQRERARGGEIRAEIE